MAGVLETLLHFDGTNGSTTFTDSTGKHVWNSMGSILDRVDLDRATRAPPPTIDTSQSKFGGSSVYFSSISNYIQIADSITLGTADFTIDFWINLNVAGNIFAVSFSDWIIYITPGGGLNWYSYNEGGQVISGATVVTTGVWHHIAFTRQGTNHYLFLDGVQQGSTWVSSINYTGNSGFPVITQGYSGNGFVGWIDEFRISLGAADWIANFTPPTAPYVVAGVYTLTAAPGAFALTGIAAGTLYGRVLQQTTVGNFTLTGIASNSSRTYLVISTTGAFAFNGTTTGLLKGDVLPMAAGTFALTGITANLIYSAGLNSYVMSASPGSFAFTGINANLVYYQLVNYVLVCGTGQFYFTGLGVGSPGQGLLSGSGLGTPVVTIPFGGAPIIDVTYLGLKAGTPVSEAAPGEGIPVTKVTTGGTPVVYI